MFERLCGGRSRRPGKTGGWRVCAICIVGSAVLPGALRASPPGGYHLAWSDEFNGDTLDTSKWDYRHAGEKYYHHLSRNEDYYLEKNVAVAGGCLVLTETTIGGTNFGAQISTEKSFNPTGGYYETRMESAQMNGTVSAFWLQTPAANNANNNPATNGVELDVIENRPFSHMADNALHWNSYLPGRARSVENYFDSPAPLGSFHVYGMLWTPTNYVFYVDGNQVWQTNGPISRRGEFIDLMLRSSKHPRGGFGVAGGTNNEARFDYVRYYAKNSPGGQPVEQ